jgi:SAM-dependent methyltransferase
MAVIESRYPNWRELTIHESSPALRGASHRLATECVGYIPSQFFPEVTLGSAQNGVRCENLESLSFPDQSIDLHITQDVMEHVFDFVAAFREIARTLRHGGAHIFTVPLVNKHNPSVIRAKLLHSTEIEHLRDPVYHGNPISEKGALVTTDWGYDIGQYVFAASGLYTDIICIDDLSQGIRAEYIEVLVTRKHTALSLGSGA